VIFCGRGKGKSAKDESDPFKEQNIQHDKHTSDNENLCQAERVKMNLLCNEIARRCLNEIKAALIAMEDNQCHQKIDDKYGDNA